MATVKQNLSRFRNLGYGKLLSQKEALSTMLQSLPSDCKSLTDDERKLLLNIRASYNDLLAVWKYNSKKLVNNVNCNL